MRSFFSVALSFLTFTSPFAAAISPLSEPAILGYVDGSTLTKAPNAYLETLQPCREVSLNVTLLETAAPLPNDVDVSQDHDLYSYNMLRNSSWSLAMRSTGTVWVHESRISTVNVTRRATHLEGRSQANYWYASAPSSSSSCSARNNELRNNLCVRWSYSNHRGGFVRFSLLPIIGANNAVYPKANIYTDENCNNYWTSIVDGWNTCLNLQATQNLQHFAVLPFNENI